MPSSITQPPSPDELTAALLAAAERETRARMYQALDLDLHLDPVGDPPTWKFGCSYVVAGAGFEPATFGL